MVHDARRHVAVLLVVEPAAVRGQRHLPVTGRRQHVGEILTGVDVADLDRDLVNASFANPVDHPLSVVGDVAQLDAGRVVRAHRMRIDQHPVLAVEPLAHIDDCQILIRTALAVEVASPPLVRQADHVPLEHRCSDRPQLLAAGQGTEHRIGVGVLGVDPGPCLGRLLVLEPAVRIGYLHAVQRVDDFTNFRRRRWRHVDSRLPGSAGHHQRRNGDPGDSSRSGHVSSRAWKRSA